LACCINVKYGAQSENEKNCRRATTLNILKQTLSGASLRSARCQVFGLPHDQPFSVRPKGGPDSVDLLWFILITSEEIQKNNNVEYFKADAVRSFAPLRTLSGLWFLLGASLRSSGCQVFGFYQELRYAPQAVRSLDCLVINLSASDRREVLIALICYGS
jgi:hypothetical protein